MNIMTGYVYDAEGRRVAKGSITSWVCDPTSNGFSPTLSKTDYVLDQEGHQVTEMGSDVNGTMAWAHTNVWAGGQLLATYSAIADSNGQADGALHFYLNDWLGTRRVQTDYAGIQEQDCSSLPFGDLPTCTQSIDGPTEHHFTGKERDSESGNDYFGARYYASTMGRFLSPDWSATEEGSDPVPYAKLDNPQTLNLYQYMENNPLGGVDADGHQGPVVFTPDGPIILPFPAAGPSGGLTQQQYNEMGNQVGGFVSAQLGYLKDIIVGDVTHPIQSLTTLFSSSNNNPAPAAPAAPLPANPDDLKSQGYDETSHPDAAAAGHRTFENPATGDKVRHDQGKPGAPGHEGEDHYHRYNPNATGKSDQYLDANGNPVPRGSDASHLTPEPPPPPQPKQQP